MDGESSTVELYMKVKSSDNIEGIDFSNWLLSNFDKKDHIILKMDIEGSEFSVLPKMFEDESIKLVDKLFIEFHYGKRRNTSIELSLNILENLIFKYNLDPLRWNATGEDTSIDKVELDWRLCEALEKEKSNVEFIEKWKKIKNHYNIEKWKKGMDIYSPNKGE